MNPVRQRARRATRSAVVAAIAGFALLALTGCLSIQGDVSINSDAKASGTFSIMLQKQAAKMMGMSDLSSFSSGITKQDAAATSGDILSAGTCEPSETADNFVYTCTFSNAEFSKEGELWTIKKDGSKIVFQMKNAGGAAAGGADAGQASDLLGGSSLGDITVNVTFPGTIEQVTGAGATKTSDTTATVKGAMTDTIDVTIISAASSSAPIGLIIGGILGLLLLAAIIVGLVLFLVRRGKKADAPADVPVEGAIVVTELGTADAVAPTEAIEPSMPIPMPGPAAPIESDVVETLVAEPVIVEDAGPPPDENPTA
jgi:hypothetical protein